MQDSISPIFENPGFFRLPCTPRRFSSGAGHWRLSFVVPQGWKYENKPGSSVGAVSLSDGRDYCMLLITQPLAVSPNANIDFTSVWEGIITPVLHDPPPRDRPLEHRSTFGYSGKLKGDTSPGRGQNRWVGLFLLETGTKAIPVIVVASSNDVYLHLYDTVVKFLDSIRVGNRASFVQKDQADQQRQVGERGAQAYYQEHFNEQQKRKELQREQRYEEQRHQEILQQQGRQGQLHQEMLQQQRRQEMLRQERRPR